MHKIKTMSQQLVQNSTNHHGVIPAEELAIAVSAKVEDISLLRGAVKKEPAAHVMAQVSVQDVEEQAKSTNILNIKAASISTNRII